jgi:hypothetical protein
VVLLLRLLLRLLLGLGLGRWHARRDAVIVRRAVCAGIAGGGRAVAAVLAAAAAAAAAAAGCVLRGIINAVGATTLLARPARWERWRRTQQLGSQCPWYVRGPLNTRGGVAIKRPLPWTATCRFHDWMRPPCTHP